MLERTIFSMRTVQYFAIALLLFCVACSVEKTDTPSANTPPTSYGDNTTPINPAPKQIDTPSDIAMISIPAGEFVMGDDAGEYDEKPARTVQVSAFYMDMYEVTQESYTALMGMNTAKHKNPQNPVEQLGWFAAIKYCNMRSQREGLTPCYDLESLVCDYTANGYRLPTEAEWEYACRAGTTTPYSFGATANALKENAWFDANAAKAPKPVGQKAPNAWGLYDMHGNVSEWCNDTYDDAYYAEAPTLDPVNTNPGTERVLRGGSWDSDDAACRSSARYSEAPGLADVCFGYDAYGFRCVRRIPDSDPPIQ